MAPFANHPNIGPEGPNSDRNSSDRNSSNRICLEMAANGRYTCKMKKQTLGQVEANWRYVYSKYRPEQVSVPHFPPDSMILLLGLGLGYELQQILSRQPRAVVIVEKHPFFVHGAQKDPLIAPLLAPSLDLDQPEVTLLLDQDFKMRSELKELLKSAIIIASNVASFDYAFYSQAALSLKPKEKEKIALFNHPTIAHDCSDALQKLGYQVAPFSFSSSDMLQLQLLQERPDYLFSINVRSPLVELSEQTQIPYIAWNVDTPVYTVYEEKVKATAPFIFSYDEEEALLLKQASYRNVFYLPVAAPSERMRQITLSSADVSSYSSPVSFVGNTCEENEYNTLEFEKRLSSPVIAAFHHLFERQKEKTSYVLYDELSDLLVKQVEKELGCSLAKGALSSRQKLALLLGRKYTEIERKEVIAKVAHHFPVKVYGDKGWEKVQAPYLTYMGHAEHYQAMPKVFQLSRINLNLTRAYVLSGLPMRVFDIIGSGGFLLSNDQKEMHRLFTPNRDVALFQGIEQLLEKIDHYLSHEQERLAIIEASQKRLKEHRYIDRLSQMMQRVKQAEGQKEGKKEDGILAN